MAAWGQWFEANGSSFVDVGNPISVVKTVGPDGVTDGGGANQLSGYGLVEAADIDAAASIAAGCPIISLSGGSVQVAETFEIDM